MRWLFRLLQNPEDRRRLDQIERKLDHLTDVVLIMSRDRKISQFKITPQGIEEVRLPDMKAIKRE